MQQSIDLIPKPAELTMTHHAFLDPNYDSGPFDPELTMSIARVIDPEAFGLTAVESDWPRIYAARQIAHATALRILVVMAKRGQIAGSEPWQTDVRRLSQVVDTGPSALAEAYAETAALLTALTATPAFRPVHNAVA